MFRSVYIMACQDDYIQQAALTYDQVTLREECLQLIEQHTEVSDVPKTMYMWMGL